MPDGAFGETMTHLRQEYIPGEFALDLFFVLSGFLITRILISERKRGVPLRYFLFRRVLRIFPIYFITIFVLFPRLTTREVVTCLTYTSNYGFMLPAEMGPLEQTWSLAVEEHFYLIWPPIIVFLGLAAAKRVIWLGFFPLAILTIVLSYAFGPWDKYPGVMHEFVFRSSTVRFASLGIGALLAFNEVRVRTSRKLALSLIVGGLLVGCLFTLRGMHALGVEPLLRQIPALGTDAHYYNRVVWGLRVISLPGLSLAFIVAAIAWSGTRYPHAIFLRALPFRAAGRISYGLYIYHLAVFKSHGAMSINRYDPSPAHVVANIVLTILLAIVSFWLLEKPLLQFGKRFRHRPSKPSEAAPAQAA